MIVVFLYGVVGDVVDGDRKKSDKTSENEGTLKRNSYILGGIIVLNNGEKIDGKKFMWDKGNYPTEAEAEEKMNKYEIDGFET